MTNDEEWAWRKLDELLARLALLIARGVLL